jgi:hypothetical protein
LEYALSLARDLAHSWPSWPPSILSVCNSSINDEVMSIVAQLIR